MDAVHAARFAAGLQPGIGGYLFSTNRPMLGLGRKLGFRVERVEGDPTLLKTARELVSPN